MIKHFTNYILVITNVQIIYGEFKESRSRNRPLRNINFETD